METCEIAIVGAGLSGLALGTALKAQGRDVRLLEARARVGGRILSEKGYDLGPAWIWPHNRRMLALVRRLGLELFEQMSAGRLVFEDASGVVRRDLEMATMGGALRVAGGLGRITEALEAELGPMIELGREVRQIKQGQSHAVISGDGFELMAERVVLALPPRLAAGFGLAVPDVPTWMAGHAKLVAVYDMPFWREMGLNGDAMSHRGPLAEIHDASPADGSEGALFGFAQIGAARQEGFEHEAIAQLARLFGPKASAPKAVMIKDWSAEAFTATRADQTPPMGHPRYRPIAAEGRVIFAGSETGAYEGGFLEGALEAAEQAVAAL